MSTNTNPISPLYLPEQVGEPWRLAEGALRDWKIPVQLKKDGVSVGNITLTIAVYDHMVALTPLPRLRGGVGAGLGEVTLPLLTLTLALTLTRSRSSSRPARRAPSPTRTRSCPSRCAGCRGTRRHSPPRASAAAAARRPAAATWPPRRARGKQGWKRGKGKETHEGRPAGAHGRYPGVPHRRCWTRSLLASTTYRSSHYSIEARAGGGIYRDRSGCLKCCRV